MPRLWSVRDGPRASATRGSGVPISFEEIGAAFAGYAPEFLSEDPPQFNVEAPSGFPSHVIVEVSKDDAPTQAFPRPGFYVLDGLSPETANQLLFKLRGKVR